MAWQLGLIGKLNSGRPNAQAHDNTQKETFLAPDRSRKIDCMQLGLKQQKN